jgi:hypothetical protein
MDQPVDMNLLGGFIERWKGADGGERAQSQSFLLDLCEVLGVERPEPASRDRYGFEFPVRKPTRPDAPDATGWIDFYRRDCFVLESKQSREKGGKKEEADLFGSGDGVSRKDRSGRAWDVLMMNARRQAEDYVRRLPDGHANPPFLIVCDVGHCFELYADFSGLGRYRQFPGRQGFRILIDDLRKPDIVERLRLVWNDPRALDPTAKSARVTREIARRLAAVSRALEAQKADPEQVAMFLMRCLFTMFAEDEGLLPRDSFKALLRRCEREPEKFQPLVQQLWQAMNTGEFAYAIERKVKRFNGNLFADATGFALGKEEIGELAAAAGADWREVEPAIFGTLLEQALDAAERKRLGAHYTPRAYVERLVNAAVIEPLEEDWLTVKGTAERLRGEGKDKAALDAVERFHDRLCETRVLDPACGTGNFLYVAFELMKRLEGEVLEAAADLGGQEKLAELERHTVDPHQFLGLEINPRAAAIAELVLWIGYLQWYFRTHRGEPPEPVLKAFRNIETRDAVLTWDGWPVPKVEGGRETYPNARRPEWPEADYIVGNPPFIGGKDIRSRLGDGYTETLWSVHGHMNESADFVMYWWDRAADLLTRKGTRLKRFGLVTTNSITQVFQRRAVERHLNAKPPVSLVFAIPDHPWTRATEKAAAVRIAMTVAAAGSQEGIVREVVSEAGLDTDEPDIVLDERRGRINADLTVGVDVTKAIALQANDGLCSPGVKLHGSGFIVTPAEAALLGLGRRPGLEKHIRPYRNGRDLTATPRGVMAIDLFGLTQDEVRDRFPEVYQHLYQTVKTQREAQARKSGTRDAHEYAARWWTMGKPREQLRPALAGLPRYIATVETAKHRAFQFLDAAILPDNMLVCVASADAFHLGVLSSRVHATWALNQGGTLEDRPRYTKSHCFDPFPFPEPDATTKAEIADLAEKIDRLRKEQQAARPGLTLTRIYNVLERLRANGPDPLTPDEERIRDEGLVLILKEYHDHLDAAVARAYGWPVDLSDDDILARLVALNGERAREERAGRVRWLRPAYQVPRFGSPREKAELDLTGSDMRQPQEAKAKPLFPADDIGQTAAVLAALAVADAPTTAEAIAAGFRQGQKVKSRIALTLVALARMGLIARADPGRYLLRRAA